MSVTRDASEKAPNVGVLNDVELVGHDELAAAPEAEPAARDSIVPDGHEAGYEVTVGHDVGFVGEVVANRVCVVTVGHEAATR